MVSLNKNNDILKWTYKKKETSLSVAYAKLGYKEKVTCMSCRLPV